MYLYLSALTYYLLRLWQAIEHGQGQQRSSTYQAVLPRLFECPRILLVEYASNWQLPMSHDMQGQRKFGRKWNSLVQLFCVLAGDRVGDKQC